MNLTYSHLIIAAALLSDGKGLICTVYTVGWNMQKAKKGKKYKINLKHIMWRRGGLIVSPFVPGSSGLGSSPGQRHCVVLCSWARHFALTAPLSIQEYKWVLPNC